MSNLLERVQEELEEVRKEIGELELNDEMIPTLSGWELALKWVLLEIEKNTAN